MYIRSKFNDKYWHFRGVTIEDGNFEWYTSGSKA